MESILDSRHIARVADSILEIPEDGGGGGRTWEGIQQGIMP